MQYNYIKGRELIARVLDNFTLDNTQWLYSAPLWIADGLAQLKIPTTYQYYRVADTVVAYKCELPLGNKMLLAIEYQGYRLRRLGAINNMSAAGLLSRGYSDTLTYELLNDNWVIFPFETGDIVFHVRIPALDYDEDAKTAFPKIPDDAYVIEALKWFIIMKMLQKGYKHPLFDLTAKAESVNPYLLWELNKKRARNSVNIIDADEKEQISLLTRKFIQNYDSYDTIFFNGYASQGNGGMTTNAVITSQFITNVTNIYNASFKYKVSVNGLNTITIPVSTHNVGINPVPALFVFDGTNYIDTLSQFTVALNGDVVWIGSSVVTDGYIILV